MVGGEGGEEVQKKINLKKKKKKSFLFIKIIIQGGAEVCVRH